MKNSVVEETREILKRLSPKNQSYFMTLVRLAEIAENGAKKEMREKIGVSSGTVHNCSSFGR